MVLKIMEHFSRLEQKDPRDLVSWVNQIVWPTATATGPRPPPACSLLIFGSQGPPVIRGSAVFLGRAVARPVRRHDVVRRMGRPSSGWTGAHSSYPSYRPVSAAFSPLPAHICLHKPISFFRLKAVQLHSHSWRTLSMPRNRNCRRFIHCLMNANCVSP